MRRAAVVLGVCLLAVTGCRGGEAQEPYDRVVVTGRGASTAAPVAPSRTVAAEPIASEVDVPWTIALLSDGEAQSVEHHADVMHVDPEVAADEPVVEDVSVDLEVAVDHDPADARPPAPKSCPGVVKGRS